MAMNKGLKIAIGFATIGVVGVGIYFLYKKVIKPKLDDKKEEKPDNVVKNVKALDEVKTKVERSPRPRTSSKTPFTSRTDGNAFREWINDTYSDYAKKINLDRSGEYDNSYIRKAWKEYGDEYQKAVADAKAKADKIANQLKVGDYVQVINKPQNSHLWSQKQQTYSRPTMTDADYKGRLYGIPRNIKYKVIRLGVDGTNGKQMAYIFNEYDKPSSNWTRGRGFLLYSKYLKKVKFNEFDGGYDL